MIAIAEQIIDILCAVEAFVHHKKHHSELKCLEGQHKVMQAGKKPTSGQNSMARFS